jgi:hypothetical protein
MWEREFKSEWAHLMKLGPELLALKETKAKIKAIKALILTDKVNQVLPTLKQLNLNFLDLMIRLSKVLTSSLLAVTLATSKRVSRALLAPLKAPSKAVQRRAVSRLIIKEADLKEELEVLATISKTKRIIKKKVI